MSLLPLQSYTGGYDEPHTSPQSRRIETSPVSGYFGISIVFEACMSVSTFCGSSGSGKCNRDARTPQLVQWIRGVMELQPIILLVFAKCFRAGFYTFSPSKNRLKLADN